MIRCISTAQAGQGSCSFPPLQGPMAVSSPRSTHPASCIRLGRGRGKLCYLQTSEVQRANQVRGITAKFVCTIQTGLRMRGRHVAMNFYCGPRIKSQTQICLPFSFSPWPCGSFESLRCPRTLCSRHTGSRHNCRKFAWLSPKPLPHELASFSQEAGGQFWPGSHG